MKALLDFIVDILKVAPRSNFRYYTTKLSVYVNLR